MITLDTSGLFAALNRTDPHHRACLEVLEADYGPRIIPTGILAEISYILEGRGGIRALSTFLEDLESRAYILDCGDRDISRIRQLVERYANLPLGFADAAVIACAERHDGRTLTTDRRHFPVVARGERTITVLPE